MVREVSAAALLVALSAASSVPIGLYMARVFTGERTWFDPLLLPLERLLLRLVGAAAGEPQTWRRYTGSLLASNAVMWAAGFLVLSLQRWLPLNPDGVGNMGWSLAFHTTSSFVTNTNLQHYSGETALSSFSQIGFATFLQFVSAATGIAACVATIRALGGDRLTHVGNFYVDATRAVVRVLLPLSVVMALVLLWQGVPMTFEGAARAATLDGSMQRIARGVVAAMEAIKQLGTNGGGYFGSNAAHPFENPTPLTGAIEQWAILVLPMAMVWTLGAMLRRRRLAVMVFATMLALYLPMAALAIGQEARRVPGLASLPIDQSAGAMEGKEVRFGPVPSALWAVSTTATSNGSVDAMHDSLTPLGGLSALVCMWLNCIFGGVGVGIINMLIFIVVAVFVAGMMIGRTPALLGKKVEAREMRLASIALLWHPLSILAGTALACLIWTTSPAPGIALAWLHNPGPHGFSEMLYEFTSATANNGSGFEGLSDNTVFWNVSTGLAMLFGRYVPIVAPLALAASLGAKPAAQETAGSLRIDSAVFGFTLWTVVVLLGLLMFLPVAVLGPIAEFLSKA